jgi:hypothetical protein
MIPRSVLFHCISSPVYEVERLRQAVLATRLNRLLTLTFSRSSGFRNTLSQILYLLHAKTGQSHTCTLGHTQRVHSLIITTQLDILAVRCPSLYKWALGLVSPLNSPTAALRLNLLIGRSSFALLGPGYLISILDCGNWQRQWVQQLTG